MKREERKLKESKLKRKRTEFLKSVLIFMLCLSFASLLYSIIKTQAFYNKTNLPFENGFFYGETDAINLYFSFTSPEYILFNTEAGREVFYTDSDYYTKAQKILEDINKNIYHPNTEITETSEDIFSDIGEKNLLYISYPYHRFPKLASQFFDNPSPKLSEQISSYKKVILLPSELSSEGIYVYIKDEKTGKTFKIQSSVPSSGLQKLLGNAKKIDDRNYSFAYELNLNNSGNSTQNTGTKLRSDIVIPHKSQFLPKLSISAPPEFSALKSGYTDDEVLSTLIKAFGFNESFIRQYIDKDDVLVCVNENATLKLYPSGIVEYSSVDKTSGVNLSGTTKNSPENSYFLSFTGVSRIINSVIPIANNNEKSFRIRLVDLQSESAEVAEYKFMFDYYLNGTRVVFSPYHAIEATTIDGYLTSMRIDLKCFENTSEKNAIEPLFTAIDRFCADKQSQSTILISDCFRSYTANNSLELTNAGWSVK